MRNFYMVRNNDESGVSGTGKVLDGVVFPDGVTVVRWCCKDNRKSTTVFDSFEQFRQIHIVPHPTNGTEIHWI